MKRIARFEKVSLQQFCEGFERLIPGDVGRGIFGADMQCEFINDGPVTIVMDSKVLS